MILMIVVAIVSLNILSTMIMLVKNKGRDIAVLRTIGASQGAVMRVFFMIGVSIGLTGCLCGVIAGALFLMVMNPLQEALGRIGIHVWSADTYFLTQIPHKIEPIEVAGTVLFCFALSILATFPPAWRASRLDPVEALRYE